MTREIKFRAWDKKENKMIVDMQTHGLILIPTTPNWSIAQSNEIKGKNVYDDYIYSWSDADILDGRYIPLQYTGIKDKNGVEIYEGDIIKYYTVFDGGKTIIREVNWKKDLNGFGIFEYSTEIIGNIYENSDLLK